MIMGQIKIIHEHYDHKPWVSLIAGLLIAILAIIRLVFDEDKSLANLVLFALVVLPPFVIVLIDIFRRNKPTVVVYNDRIEVRMPLQKTPDEIMYSDIRNLALQAGQLRIWLDEASGPSCYNLGTNAKNAQETYNILRATFDKYNQEHNIKSVPVENMPKKKTGLGQVVFIITFLAIIMLLFILRH